MGRANFQPLQNRLPLNYHQKLSQVINKGTPTLVPNLVQKRPRTGDVCVQMG